MRVLDKLVRLALSLSRSTNTNDLSFVCFLLLVLQFSSTSVAMCSHTLMEL